MPTIDLGPAAQRMADVVHALRDGQLDDPTPCAGMTIGDLADHVGGVAVAFTAAARKRPLGAPAPSADASRLEDGWRARLGRDLDALADAWRAPGAQEGMTSAGGLDMPGEVAAVVALDELVLHGWDLARAAGRPYECDLVSLEAVHGFVARFSGPGHDEARAGLFGPELPVATDAPLLDRVLAMAGRDARWPTPVG